MRVLAETWSRGHGNGVLWRCGEIERRLLVHSPTQVKQVVIGLSCGYLSRDESGQIVPDI